MTKQATIQTLFKSRSIRPTAQGLGLIDAMEKSARGGEWNHMWDEHLGTVTSALAPGILGAIIGSHVAKDPAKGLMLGGSLGLGGSALAQIIGSLSGFMGKRRSASEQKEYDASNTPILTNLLVPGSSGWNLGKRMRSKVSDDSKDLTNAPMEVGGLLTNAILAATPGINIPVGTANLLGGAIGAIRPGRSAEEQKVYDESTLRGLLNFVPGMAQYNAFRRVKADV